jgi:hypothetical protein
MKKAGFLVFALVLAGFTAGCKSSPNANSPKWLNDLPPEDVLWGIGSAKQNSESLSMTTAETRARVAIARQINASVQAMFVDYNRDAGTTGRQANLSLQEDVSRTVTNMQLNGAKPIKKWKAPNKTWWYLVEYRKADAVNAMAGVFDSEAARYTEFKAEEALKMLETQLAKNSKSLQVAE